MDRLLASPHYGEKWARHWLDLARYADSDGYEKDLVRPYAWRYRHWVINALNQDMPFDQFTVEQIAGDLLPKPTVEQRVATGFHRNVLTNREAGVDRAEARFEQDINRANTISTVWLGLTAGCAQCHNHKFDPISQNEYYQLFAYVSNIEEDDIDAPMPGEIGPYLKARPEYDKQARGAAGRVRRCRRNRPRGKPKVKQRFENPGVDIEWDFMVTSMRAYGRQRHEDSATSTRRSVHARQQRANDRCVPSQYRVPTSRRTRLVMPSSRKCREKLDEAECDAAAVHAGDGGERRQNCAQSVHRARRGLPGRKVLKWSRACRPF